MKQAHRFSGPGRAYEGLTKLTKAGPQWTGIVRPVEAALLEPLSWRKPRRVFVNSMSDLFHDDVPDVFIDRVFAVMGLAKQHTFQVLTKRANRMRCWMLRHEQRHPNQVNVVLPDPYGKDGAVVVVERARRWPLPNVWLGVSAEDQKHADERIPLLLQTPAAVRFISAEPLLGPLFGLDQWLGGGADNRQFWTAHFPVDDRGFAHIPGLDWVIVGGESGPGARPFDVAWARSILDQCKSAGVACFVKQLGAHVIEGELIRIHLHDRKGGDPTEWPESFRVREWPEARA